MKNIFEVECYLNDDVVCHVLKSDLKNFIPGWLVLSTSMYDLYSFLQVSWCTWKI